MKTEQNINNEPTWLHIDMDAFFASVEQQRDPSLIGKAVAVVGGGGRGVITTASYEARKYGIKSGMALYEGKARCKDLVVVVGNHKRYTAVSREMIDIFRSYTPDVDVFSIDEAFLDVAGSVKLFGSPSVIAEKIKDAVTDRFGITCSVGIAQNKLLAKLASGMQKPNGTTLIMPEEVPALMNRTKVGALCGIGPRLQKELGALGIRTCGDLARYPEDLLKRKFGKSGERLVLMAKGGDDGYIHRIGGDTEPTKSVGHSMTFDHNLYEPEEVEKKLRQLAIMVGKRARRYGLSGKNISVSVRFGDFSNQSRQTSFSTAINRDDEIFTVAARLLAELKTDKPIRLLGIGLSNLVSGDRNPSVFGDENRRNALQQASDKVIDRYGSEAIGPAILVDTAKQDVVIPPSWRPDGVRNPTSDR